MTVKLHDALVAQTTKFCDKIRKFSLSWHTSRSNGDTRLRLSTKTTGVAYNKYSPEFVLIIYIISTGGVQIPGST